MKKYLNLLSITTMIAVILTSLLLVSCKDSINENATTGSVRLILKGDGVVDSSKTIKPTDTELTNATYKISGTGPDSKTVSETAYTSGTEIKGLALGSWTFTIKGYNNTNPAVEITSGTVTVNIAATPTPVTTIVNLAYLTEGTGKLSFTFSWPSTDTNITNAKIILTPKEGQADTYDIPNLDTIPSNSFSYQNATLSPGVYTLNLKLLKGSTEIGYNYTDTVHIYAGLTSTATKAFTEGELPVNAPTITPSDSDASAKGTLTERTITLASTTNGSNIYYTTDGTTDPTISSTKYTAPFKINKNTLIKAIALKDGMFDSAITTSAKFLVNAVAPTIKYNNGAVVALPYDANGKDVTLATTSTGATIYYTTGLGNLSAAPTATDPTNATTDKFVNNGTIKISQNTQVKAMAYDVNDYVESAMTTANFTMQAQTPTFVTATDTTFAYNASGTDITITANTNDSIKWTTTDTANASGNGVTVNIKKNTTVTAISYQTNVFEDSDSATATYKVRLPLTVSLDAGTHTGQQKVTLTSISDAKIYYTTDGTTPTASTLTNVKSGETITIDKSCTLKAIAVLADYENSAVESRDYVIVNNGSITINDPERYTLTLTAPIAIQDKTATVAELAQDKIFTSSFKNKANADVSSGVVYAWYADGSETAIVNATTSSYTLTGTQLMAGPHLIRVTATIDGRTYSEQFFYTVTTK